MKRPLPSCENVAKHLDSRVGVRGSLEVKPPGNERVAQVERQAGSSSSRHLPNTTKYCEYAGEAPCPRVEMLSTESSPETE